MPRGMSAVAATVNSTTDNVIFQSDNDLKRNGLGTVANIGVITAVAAPGDGAPCSEVEFSVASGSANPLRVRIPGLMGPRNGTSYAFLLAGETKRFIYVKGPGREPGIDVVFVSSVGTATFNFAVTA